MDRAVDNIDETSLELCCMVAASETASDVEENDEA